MTFLAHGVASIARPAFVLALALGLAPLASSAQSEPTVNVGFAKCAHCLPMALTPEYTKAVKINAVNFTSGNDVLTALVGGSIDVAQVTYLHFVRALDQGIPIVAISGQINGGSENLVRKDLGLKQDDWKGLKALIARDKKDGKPFRLAASRGNAQDIHWRGEFLNHGVDPDKDVTFVNIPNPADDAAALSRGEIEMVASVEPFASQIRLSGAGDHYSYPYDQAAGKLTNLIVTTPAYAQKHPKEVEEVVRTVVKLVDRLKAKDGNAAWLGVISKYTALDDTIARSALKNAYPDYDIHYPATVAIAKMMKDLHYVDHDIAAADIESHIDYSYLIKVTGKSKDKLGFTN